MAAALDLLKFSEAAATLTRPRAFDIGTDPDPTHIEKMFHMEHTAKKFQKTSRG